MNVNNRNIFQSNIFITTFALTSLCTVSLIALSIFRRQTVDEQIDRTNNQRPKYSKGPLPPSTTDSKEAIGANNKVLPGISPPKEPENLEVIREYTDDGLGLPDYTIHSDQFEILDSIIEKIPDSEIIAASSASSTTTNLGIDWFYIHKPTMIENGLEGVYEKLRECLENADNGLLRVRVEDEGIFIPHSNTTINHIILNMLRDITITEYYDEAGWNSEKFIQGDEDKIKSNIFFIILNRHNPEIGSDLDHFLTTEEIETKEQVFLNLQEKVKVHYQYEICTGPTYVHQESYVSAAATFFKSLSEEPAKRPNGIIIGEAHQYTTPKEYLSSRMERLKELDYTELYLEHIPASLQQLFDADWNSLASMPSTLHTKLMKLDRMVRKNGSKFSDVVVAAKKAGIRVVFFETVTSYDTVIHYAQGSKHDPRRVPMMNFRLWERMQEIPPRGKYLALVGSDHLVKNKESPGLNEILGGVAVHIFDKPN